MYKNPTSELASPNVDIMNSIEGYDVFNSKLIFLIDNTKDATYAVLNTYMNRLDLLASNIYKSPEYYGLTGLVTRFMDPSDLYKNSLFKYIKQNKLPYLIGDVANDI